MTAQIPCPKAECKQNCLPVSHNGQVYACVTAMHRATGISTNAIYKALSKFGSTEICGKARGGRYGNSKPVTVGKYSWASTSEMARDLNVNRSTLCKQLQRDPDKALAAVMRWERKKETSQ